MSKKTGVFAFASGVLAGVGALFFSSKSNRNKTKKIAKKANAKAKQLKTEYQKNPKKFQARVKRQGKTLAKKVLKKSKSKLIRKKITRKKSTKKTA